MAQFPPQSLRGEFAVSFVGPLEPPPPEQNQTSCSDDALPKAMCGLLHWSDRVVWRRSCSEATRPATTPDELL